MIAILGMILFLGSKIVMFGDETWSRISPVKFLREDPTSSFYVTDYTQVEKKEDNVETVSIHMHQFVTGNE